MVSTVVVYFSSKCHNTGNNKQTKHYLSLTTNWPIHRFAIFLPKKWFILRHSAQSERDKRMCVCVCEREREKRKRMRERMRGIEIEKPLYTHCICVVFYM